MAVLDFETKLKSENLDLSRKTIDTLQLNITKLCNQACVHCHVDSSPRRRETMSKQILERCIDLISQDSLIETVDLTGGAPELHPDFIWLVKMIRELGRNVIVRHNLTVTWDKHPRTGESMEFIPEFFKEHQVKVVSSLPYYQQYFTDRQRGDGVFEKSIKSLKLLNSLGYGMPASHLTLDLVYNPVGPYLPGSQSSLELDYKRELEAKFGIYFSNLYTITNMPINRFAAQLKKLGSFEEYMEKLHSAFNPEAAKSVMCRNIISLSYDGKIYDCDFNQMLGMSQKSGGENITIFDTDFASLHKKSILFANHCYGCTAGSGSSCGGATT